MQGTNMARSTVSLMSGVLVWVDVLTSHDGRLIHLVVGQNLGIATLGKITYPE
jgi:hypothetical protein